MFKLHIIFLIFAQKHKLWALVRTASPSICPQDVAVKKKLPLYRTVTCTRIINDKKPFSLIYSKEHMLWIFVRIALVRRF